MTLFLQPDKPTEPSARPVKFVRTQASVLLDLVRALAALVVLSEHWRNIFFIDFSQLHAHKSLLLIPYLLVSAGHQAVIIFFVLSGYLISGSIFRMFQQDRWSWRIYLLHRLLRLWIVLIPGLVLTAMADRFGMALQRPYARALYSGMSGDHIVGPVRATAGLFTAIGNLLFLQGIRVNPFGSDGALWSLANEFWYYLLFPLAFIAMRRKSPVRVRVLHAILFLAVAWFVRDHILAGFPIWLFGTLLAAIPPPRLGAGIRWVASGVYAVLFYAFARLPQLQIRGSDYLLGIATFIFLWILLSANTYANEESVRTRATRMGARFSYTLYVAHTPLLVLVAALVLGNGRWQPDAAHVGLAFVPLVVAIIFCFVLATLTEFRTDAVRAAIERRFQLSKSA